MVRLPDLVRNVLSHKNVTFKCWLVLRYGIKVIDSIPIFSKKNTECCKKNISLIIDVHAFLMYQCN